MRRVAAQLRACPRKIANFLVVSQADTRIPGLDPAKLECCTKAYEEWKDEPCDTPDMQDHYCVYVNAQEYGRITTIGIIITLLMSAICAAVIVSRDLLKMWTPANKVAPIPARQMTTMTAGYAGETMPVVTESNAGPEEVKA